MKLLCKLTALAVCVALLLSLASCADFGAGENEYDFKKYFSGVYVLSKSGAQKYSIEDFNRDISIDDMDIPVVVPYEEYCYIGFRVADGYTVSLSEFAFFARSQSGSGVLELEFYIVDEMPTSIKGEDGSDIELPSHDEEETQSPNESETNDGSETDGENETDSAVREEDLFTTENKFHVSTFSVEEEWDSVLLEFEGSKAVNANQYIVVRINNNCYLSNHDEKNVENEDAEEEKIPSASFTFNYLLFHFTDAHKE